MMPGRAQSRLRPSHWAWPGLGFWGPAWPGFWPEAEAGTSLGANIWRVGIIDRTFLFRIMILLFYNTGRTINRVTYAIG